MSQWKKEECPVCEGRTGGVCLSSYSQIGQDGAAFNCSACGYFEVSKTALAGRLAVGNETLNKIQRAALSHAIRRNQETGKVFLITNDWLPSFMETAWLPSPVQQATNLIRAVGNHVTKTGDPFPAREAATCALVGAADLRLFGNLVASLIKSNRIVELGFAYINTENGIGERYPTYDLSLAGWEQYEDEKRGMVSGNYGFIAMKFGDYKLETLVRDTIKPKVGQDTGYEVIDVRDRSRAGVIDNILREQIRDAAFVLVDLSHDNNGAYWEAGYAEGLGKPVIYICEQKKFDQTRTHFDTNHCTTIMWGEDDDLFARQLIATIRRSLRL